MDDIISRSEKYVKKSVDKDFAPLSRERKIAYIKDRKWKYEREYRIVFDRDDEAGLIHEDDKWFMSVKIKNVYLGVNFYKNDLEIQKGIMEACERNKIKVTKMVLSASNYSVGPMGE